MAAPPFAKPLACRFPSTARPLSKPIEELNHRGTERTEIKPLAEAITGVATNEHKELKENFPVIYVLFCGETAFGFILMQRASSLRSISSVSFVSLWLVESGWVLPDLRTQTGSRAQ
jgi:hypothetical protein